MQELLFQPIQIGPITVPNRIVMPAMHLNFTMGGEVSDQLIHFYRARAEGGAGLIILGGCAIDDEGGGFFLVGMHDDRFVPGLKRFVDEVGRDVESKLCAQLYHAGRYAMSWYTQKQPIAPSALASRYNPEQPREMSLEDIERVQQAFVDAAVRAADAGFHAVEIIGSAGYLIAEFLSPAANKRTDEYGGDLAHRARFGCEIVKRVKEAVGDRVAVLIRVAGADFVPGGNSNAEAAQAARMFQEAGADAINVTGGWHESRVPQITMNVPEGAYTYLAANIRRAVDVPVIASNRLGDPRLAAQVIANEDADLVAMGRPLIADPELPAKVSRGDIENVRPCIACNQGCFDHVFSGSPVSCVLNPRAGYERERLIEAAPEKKRVVVIGAGPAGVEAARVAAARGHDVVLLEEAPVIGGALWYAGFPPGRHDFFRYIHFMEAELVQAGVDLWLQDDVDVTRVKDESPDAVIVATGAAPVVPEFARDATHPNVVLAADVLAGRVAVEGDVVIVGGGAVGTETALYIAHRDTISPEVAAFLLANDAEPPERVRELLTQTRRDIHICELKPKIGEDLGKTTRWTILQDVQRYGVKSHTKATVERIDEEGVTITTEDGKEQTLRCGTVVVAVGYRPRNELADALKAADLPVTVIGDAKEPRTVFEAIHEGFLAAFEI